MANEARAQHKRPVRSLLLVLLSSIAVAEPLDPEQTELAVLVWKRGIAAAAGHDHVVRATRFGGSLDRPDPAHVKVDVTIETASLIPDEPALREKLRVGPAVKDSDRKTIEEHLKGPGQLDVEKFGTIHFESTQSQLDERGKGSIKGRLTLHGVTREVECPVTVTLVGNRLRGSARLRLALSDYGVQPFSALLGLLGNRDVVELVIELVTRPLP